MTKRGMLFKVNKVRCRDCYRCVRVCPVKAIRMHNRQAFVVPERYISCGTCIRECPQGAKSYRNDLEHAIRLIASRQIVSASVAPSFAAVFSPCEQKYLASALRKLRFAFVAETAVGAYPVAQKTSLHIQSRPDQPHVCTVCPAVVRYVERYQPKLIDRLVPVVSPMLAHARHLKEKMGLETKVVFIGPCVAKKPEVEQPQNEGFVDCVLTFEELAEWFNREGISLTTLEESGFDEIPEGEARFFSTRRRLYPYRIDEYRPARSAGCLRQRFCGGSGRRKCWPKARTRGSWSRVCRPMHSTPRPCTKRNTAAGGRWKIASRSSSFAGLRSDQCRHDAG